MSDTWGRRGLRETFYTRQYHRFHDKFHSPFKSIYAVSYIVALLSMAISNPISSLVLTRLARLHQEQTTSVVCKQKQLVSQLKLAVH